MTEFTTLKLGIHKPVWSSINEVRARRTSVLHRLCISFKAFYEETKSISLKSSNFPEAVQSLEDIKVKLKSRHPILAEDNLKVKDLPDKKTHEISRMANLVADICDQTNTYNVIDIGGVFNRVPSKI